ncbi:MAG: ferredoxin [Deltaproteobacteria bacterium]|nr:ferredoxin [Deltaproteobacteria bacterium]
MQEVELHVERARCIRCGACASLAPGVFALRGEAYDVARQPATDEERVLARAAVLNCPSHAIRVAR